MDPDENIVALERVHAERKDRVIIKLFVAWMLILWGAVAFTAWWYAHAAPSVEEFLKLHRIERDAGTSI